MNEIKSINQPLNMALRYLGYRPRTVFEMQTYLKKKGVDENIRKKIIETLLKKNYLNDRDFAVLFIESKVKTRPKSKFAFQYELKKKGICPSISDTILARYNDQDLAINCVSPKIKLWQNLDGEKFKKKMNNFLRYRGFNYEICLSTLNHFIQKTDTIKGE